MKLTISRSKNSVSFYVQKTIRKEDGTTSSVTVEKLGNLEQVKTRAKGQDPYEWAKAYVEELNAKEYDQKKEILVPYSPSKLLRSGEQKSFNIGYLFLQNIYYSLGLHKICESISKRYKFEYDLNDILSKLVYTRILYPSSKLSSNKQAQHLLEQPSFKLHDIYRSLSVLSEGSDYIQSELYKNSQKVIERRKDILYYDCTNFYFETEEADELRRYGKSKQHQPLPLVGMGLFMDYDGIPLAFDIFPGNLNEQPTLVPIEKRVLEDYGLDEIIVCTDAGLSSASNRRFNDKSIRNHRIRSFITTQSVKQLPDYLKEFSLDPQGWHLLGDDKTYNLSELNLDEHYEKVFYKERWIKEGMSAKKIKTGQKPLEQRLIVSFSLKYQEYQRRIREKQIGRAISLIETGNYKKKHKNQNDPLRFVAKSSVTENGEVCSKEYAYLDESVIREEQRYDGFYAVCTNVQDLSVEQIVRINRRRWEIEDCFRLMKTEFKARPVYLQTQDHIKSHFITCFISLMIFRLLEKKLGEEFTSSQIVDCLKQMNVMRPGEKFGYLPAYTRTTLTDRLHETAGFRTDYEIIKDLDMKRIIRNSKNKK